MITDERGNKLLWNWSYGGRGLNLYVQSHDEDIPSYVFLSEDQVEELVNIVCTKLGGAFVPHCANGKAKVAISHNAAQWALRSVWTCNNFNPGERVDHVQRKRVLADAQAEIRAAFIAAGGREP